MLVAKLLVRHYQKAVFPDTQWSQLQKIKREVDTMTKCGALCLKNEECRAFHFKNETKLCSLAVADVLDLVKNQMYMRYPQSPNTNGIEVFTESEGKILINKIKKNALS